MNPLENSYITTLVSDLLDVVMQARAQHDDALDWGAILIGMTIALKMAGQMALSDDPDPMTQEKHDAFMLKTIAVAMQCQVQAVRMENKEEYDAYMHGLEKGQH